VGFDKINKQISTLDELKIVILDGLRISQPHESEANAAHVQADIAKTCPKVVQLDLGRNLFESLDEIGMTCAALHSLAELRVE
jgi:tubulin-specific chaperone E